MRMTCEQIAARFEACVTTLNRLPGERSLGYASYWPDIVYTPRELAGQDTRPLRVQATPKEIALMEEALGWIHWVNSAERKLIWLRAYRTPWRVIARETGYPRTSAQRYWQGALTKIAQRLEPMRVCAG